MQLQTYKRIPVIISVQSCGTSTGWRNGKRAALWHHSQNAVNDMELKIELEPAILKPHRSFLTWTYLSNTTAARLGSEKMTSPAQNSLVAFRPLPFPGESNIATFSIVTAAPEMGTVDVERVSRMEVLNAVTGYLRKWQSSLCPGGSSVTTAHSTPETLK